MMPVPTCLTETQPEVLISDPDGAECRKRFARSADLWYEDVQPT